MTQKRVCLGVFAGAHGVQGATKIKTFTDAPEDIDAYGPVQSEDGSRTFTLKYIRTLKSDLILATSPEILHREDAMSLKGVKVFVQRSALPEPQEDEFYLEDLIHLGAIGEGGETLGVISAVHNFGAGDIVEISKIPGVKGAHLVPFTKEAVPTVDLSAKRVVIANAHSPFAENETENSTPQESDG